MSATAGAGVNQRLARLTELGVSIWIDEISSSMPPPTWNDASEMPKNSMIFRPASALSAITRKAVKALTRMVRRRASAERFCVKWMKNGTTPTGLTIASSAISGLSSSMGAIVGRAQSAASARR